MNYQLSQPKDSATDGDWHELAYEGDFIYPKTKEKFSIGQEHFESWKERFTDIKELGGTIPVVKNHSIDPLDRIGTIEDVEIREEPRKSFWVKLSAHDQEVKTIINKSSLSVMTRAKMTDSNGKEYSHALIHVGVTDYPVIPGLQKDLALSIIFEKDLDEKSIRETKGDQMKPFALALGLKEDATEAEILTAITSAKETLKAERVARIEKLSHIEEETRNQLKAKVEDDNFEFMLSLLPAPSAPADFETDEQNHDDQTKQCSLVDAVNRRIKGDS